MTSTENIPISLLVHMVFCPRRAWLEAQGEQADSFAMTAGSVAHTRVDDPAESRPGTERAMLVHSDELGLTGRCDVVHSEPNGTLTIQEYKSTPVRRKPQIRESQRIQVLAEVMCLESMGYTVTGAEVHFINHHKSIPLPLSPAGREECLEWIRRTREMVRGSRAPEPLLDDPRCASCSHATICLPDEHHHTNGSPTRRISASDPEGEIVHVMTPGARAFMKERQVVIAKNGETLASCPIERISGMVVHGNVDLSSALVRELLWRRLSIVWCSGRGRVVGWATSARLPNGQARIHQQAMSEYGCLPLAQAMIKAKISNQATLLRRNGGGTSATTSQLRALGRQTTQVSSLPDLFALEGRAAQIYFTDFPSMLKGTEAEEFLEAWPGRHGRGATDPLNAALNFCYGLLLADCIRGLTACGLDPHGGFLHSPSRNKPALALDLMEEFRAPIADSVVITCINNRSLTPGMFSRTLGDTRLKAAGRNALTTAYEHKATTEIAHLIFGYTTSWRRAIEVQARILLGVIDGTRSEYKGMTIR